MLNVQNYLLSGNSLSDLETLYGIKYRVDTKLGVVCLNYNPIVSPVSVPMVQECRALILELNTWNVLSLPFYRFYNYGEIHVPTSFNWNKFGTFMKLDGSLVSLWYTSDNLSHFATKSVPDASCGYDESGNTFNSLIEKAIEDMTGHSVDDFLSYFCPGFCYTFELTTPENQLVVQNKERKLTLLAIRDIETLEETLPSEWVLQHTYPYPIAKGFSGLTFEQVKEKVADINPLDEEGYVIVDDKFNRIKIKSDSHVLLSRCRDSLGKSAKNRLEIILMEKMDDVWPVQPVWIQDKLTEMKYAIKILSVTISNAYNEVKHMTNQKDFALAIKDLPYKNALFSLRKGKPTTAIDWIKEIGLKNPKNMINLLKEVDSELDVQEEE